MSPEKRAESSEPKRLHEALRRDKMTPEEKVDSQECDKVRMSLRRDKMTPAKKAAGKKRKLDKQKPMRIQEA